MERIIKTKKYGEVTVKNCMLENNDNTTVLRGKSMKTIQTGTTYYTPP